MAGNTRKLNMAKTSPSSEAIDRIVLTAIAKDRPGVVESLADVIARHSGNWVDSSMANLGGEFAGIVMVEIDAGKTDVLKKDLKGLKDEGIDVTVHATVAAEVASGREARLELTGLDHPGIVLEITRTLARHRVNIDEFNTSVSRGSMGAEPMFSAEANIVLPPDVDTDTLREALEHIAGDIMVDIELSEI